MIKPGADKPTVEIDFGAIGNGQVILCEAKSCDTVTSRAEDEKRDTGKLITACCALTGDVLCLATTQPEWSARTRATVQAACDEAGMRTLWLERLWAAAQASPAAAAAGE
jgi:hypothetical protein